MQHSGLQEGEEAGRNKQLLILLMPMSHALYMLYLPAYYALPTTPSPSSYLSLKNSAQRPTSPGNWSPCSLPPKSCLPPTVRVTWQSTSLLFTLWTNLSPLQTSDPCISGWDLALMVRATGWTRQHWEDTGTLEIGTELWTLPWDSSPQWPSGGGSREINEAASELGLSTYFHCLKLACSTESSTAVITNPTLQMGSSDPEKESKHLIPRSERQSWIAKTSLCSSGSDYRHEENTQETT